MFNLISVGCFVLMIGLSVLLQKCSKKELIMRIVSVLLFVWKFSYILYQNIIGIVSIPIEISTISYFIMFATLIFRIKGMYCVSSLLGILAGVVFFGFYMVAGFTLQNVFTLKAYLTGCLFHGYLLVSGLYLFKNYKFDKKEQPKIWITTLAIICWSLVFYGFVGEGITFIYYIVKPEFLLVFKNMSLNALVLIVYYCLLVSAYYGVIKGFFALNNKVKKTVAETYEVEIKTSCLY